MTVQQILGSDSRISTVHNRVIPSHPTPGKDHLRTKVGFSKARKFFVSYMMTITQLSLLPRVSHSHFAVAVLNPKPTEEWYHRVQGFLAFSGPFQQGSCFLGDIFMVEKKAILMMNEYPSKPQHTFGGTQHDGECDYVGNPRTMAGICKSLTYGGRERIQ